MSKNIFSLLALTFSLVAGNAQAQSIFQSQYQTQPVNYTQPNNYTQPVNYAPVNTLPAQYNSTVPTNSFAQPNCVNGQCFTGQCPNPNGVYNPQAAPVQNQTYYRGNVSPYGFQNQGYSAQTTQGEILPLNNFNGANPNFVNPQGTNGNFNPANGSRRPRPNADGTPGIWSGTQPCVHPGCVGHSEADVAAFRTRMQHQWNAGQYQNQTGTFNYPQNNFNQYQANTNQNLQIQMQQPLQNNPAVGSPFFN